MRNISLFTSMENNLPNAKLELGNYFLIRGPLYFSWSLKEINGTIRILPMRNTCISKEAVTNDCKASKMGGTEGVLNKLWTGKLLVMGPALVLTLTTWPGHPGKAFNLPLKSTGRERERPPAPLRSCEVHREQYCQQASRSVRDLLRWLTLLLSSLISIMIINNG